jgi:hypothetical protein
VPATSHRAIAVENLRVGKLSTAQSFAFRLLEHYSVERRTVSFTTRLPSTKIGLLQAGMRVGLRFIELPDISTLQYYRIETLTVAPTDGDPTHYDAQVTASVHGLGFAPGTGGGSTTPFPHQPPAGASIVQTGCGSAIGGAIPVTFPAPVTVGSTIVVAAVWRDGTTSTTADTNNGGTPNLVTFTLVDRVTLNGVATEDAVMMYRVVTEDDLAAGPGTTYTFGAGAGTGRPQSMGWELAGVTAPTASVRIDNATGTSYSFPSLTISGAGIAIGMSGLGSDNPAPATFTPSDHFYLESTGGFWQTLIGMDQLRTAAGSQVYSATFTVSGGGNQHDGIVAFFPTDSASSAPLPGQWSEWKTITMAGAVGDLGFPYASGSLQIKVDSVLISAASYTENNTAGTFTLSWITDTDETVTARAQGI